MSPRSARALFSGGCKPSAGSERHKLKKSLIGATTELKLQEVIIMNSFFRLVLIVGCCLIVAVGAAFAQAQTPGTNDSRIQNRMENQEQRIDQGVQSGALTPKETGKLEADQTKIEQTEQRMKSDGKLTGKERQRLHNMQDRSSQHIYRQKHDAQKAPVKAQ
jgi:hypothetical protein